MTWPQATEESIKDFLVEGLRVRAWPTAILLDPAGKIISLGRRCRPSAVPNDCVDEPGLRFSQLEETLAELLGAHWNQFPQHRNRASLVRHLRLRGRGARRASRVDPVVALRAE